MRLDSESPDKTGDFAFCTVISNRDCGNLLDDFSNSVDFLYIVSRKKILFALASLSLLALGLLFIDRIVIPQLEDKRILVSRGWKEETWKVAQMSYQRWKHPPNTFILQSDGIPVSERKSKAKRILIAGDSFAAGYGLVNINDVWWRALQRELISRGYNDVEVIGVCGGHQGATAGILNEVERVIDRYQPDALIFGYVSDDADELKDGHYIVPHLMPFEPDGVSKVAIRIARSIFPNLTEIATSWQQKLENERRSGPVHGYDHNQRELEFLKGSNLAQYQTTLARMSEVIKKAKIPSFVVTLPCSAGFFPEFDSNRPAKEYIEAVQAYYKQRYDGISPSFRNAHIRFVDLLEPYIELLKTDPHLKGNDMVHVICATPVDGHPSGFVTHFYASKVADLLENEYPLVLGKKGKVEQNFQLKVNDWMPPSINAYRLAERKYIFTFPKNPLNQLSMPIRKAHVQLNFEMPSEVRTIKLQGASLKSSTIWITSVDREDGYDRRVLHKLNSKKGSFLIWQLPDEPWTRSVNTVKIAPELKGSDYRLAITF